MNNSRGGTFSSSNNWKLMTNDRSGKGLGAPAKTYIRQVGYERQLGRPISPERDARQTSWGTLTEKFVFAEKLPLAYKLVNDQRWFHPSLPWSGSPDLMKGLSTVADVKCPFNLDVFCQKLEVLSSGDSELYKAEFPEDYWQHISNAALLQVNGLKMDSFEAIIYCPKKTDLDALRSFALNYDGPDQYRFKWIAFANDEELPYIVEEGFIGQMPFSDLNIFKFEIPSADKRALHDRIEMAAEQLLTGRINSQKTIWKIL